MPKPSAYIYLLSGLFAACCLHAPDLYAGDEDLLDEEIIAPAVTNPFTRIESLYPPSVKTSSGRFMIIGRDRVMAQSVGVWIENLVRQSERVTGLEFDSGKIMVRFVLPEQGGTATDTVVRVENDGAGGRGFVVRLPDSDQEPYIVMETILGCLFGSSRWMNGAISNAPAWIVEGITQNLYPEYLKQCMDQSALVWRNGELGMLSDYLGGVKSTNITERSVRCAMVAWLLEREDRAVLFQKILKEAGAGVTIDALWIASNSPGITSVVELEEAWDTWMLKQKRIVRLPGSDKVGDLQWLNGQLLLSSEGFATGDNKTPLSLSPDEVAEGATAPWLREAARSRALSIRIYSAGRCDDCRAAAQAYGRFYDAVAEDVRVSRLKALLMEAASIKAKLQLAVDSEQIEAR